MAHTPPGRTREQVFRFVRRRLLQGTPPTVREVQEEMGFAAVESARKHLEALVAQGRLVKSPGRARGYRLSGAASKARPAAVVPLLGDVHAGQFHEAIETPDGYLLVETRTASEHLFALRVRGESMTGVGILPGDCVVVKRNVSPRSGDIVVAMVEGDATVKRLRFRGRRTVLEPANPDFEPIVCEAGEVRILGRVVEVRRTLR